MTYYQSFDIKTTYDIIGRCAGSISIIINLLLFLLLLLSGIGNYMCRCFVCRC